ncbi:B3 domain-containing protein REM9-like [Chenopodium quinoa]|uniref:B3 domain-containing protein REM9-like n=1 Tax=Chenopodium quinoa TaxID=63459 RepID=UPI000B76B954|nr:B3 domain-containing protein REM9-like [Chenopodium quinoa]
MMESSSKLIHNAHFMQPLLSGFLSSFVCLFLTLFFFFSSSIMLFFIFHAQSIPMAFVKLLEKELKVKSMESMPSVVLTTDDEPGCHWFVKLEGGRLFKDGWKEFCHHHGLKVGDFVVFSHQLNLIFQVSVFDPVTYCQRYFTGLFFSVIIFRIKI